MDKLTAGGKKIHKNVVFFEREFAKIQLFVLCDLIDLERSFAIHYNSRKYDLKTIHDRGIRCSTSPNTRHIKWVPAKFSFDIDMSQTKIRLRIDTLRNITVAFVTHAPREEWSRVERWLNDRHPSPVILDLANLRHALGIVDSFAEQGLYSRGASIAAIEGVSVVDNDPESTLSQPNVKNSSTCPTPSDIFRRPSYNGYGIAQPVSPSSIALLHPTINTHVFYTLFFIGRHVPEMRSCVWAAVLYDVNGTPLYRESAFLKDTKNYRIGSYLALHAGLNIAKALGIKHIVCKSSNNAVIRRLNKDTLRKDAVKELAILAAQIDSLIQSVFSIVTFEHTITEYRNRARQLVIDLLQSNSPLKELVVDQHQ